MEPPPATNRDDYRGTPDGLTAPPSHAWFHTREVPDGFLDMIESLRELQDRVTAADPPADLVADVTKSVTELSARLAAHAVDERHQLVGHLPDVPGRGQTLVPPFVLDELDEQHARAHVRFGRHYLGGNGAVHGGALPLVFDELMGRLANTGDRKPSRTAFLNVDYRAITPIGAELRVSAWFEVEEGRKRFLRGAIHHGETLCAEAHGLFVELLPGQP
jgi:acyl-coenzyme A thioesterase PaaI-like protein